MTTKHTPGPWSRHSYGYLVGPDGETPIYLRNATNLLAGSEQLTAEAEANMTLCSAAPELLDACMAMLEWDDREQDHAVDFYARMDLCRAAFDKARAAIAKAKGEQL